MPTIQSISLQVDNNTDITDAQLLEDFIIKVKETYEYADREILEIKFAQWHPIGSSMMIIPLDDEGEWILDDYIGLTFNGPPTYDMYGKEGLKAEMVEKFIEQINDKHFEGVVLNSFIQKDLIITLEFSDGSLIIFDRYYKEIEENLDYFNRIGQL